MSQEYIVVPQDGAWYDFAFVSNTTLFWASLIMFLISLVAMFIESLTIVDPPNEFLLPIDKEKYEKEALAAAMLLKKVGKDDYIPVPEQFKKHGKGGYKQAHGPQRIRFTIGDGEKPIEASVLKSAQDIALKFDLTGCVSYLPLPEYGEENTIIGEVQGFGKDIKAFENAMKHVIPTNDEDNRVMIQDFGPELPCREENGFDILEEIQQYAMRKRLPPSQASSPAWSPPIDHGTPLPPPY